MTKNRKDTFLLSGFLLSFAAIILWGYVSGDFQKLFRHHSPEAKAAAQQRALDHLFGSDQAFDPAADNVSETVESEEDNISWKILAHAQFKIENGNTSPGVDFGEDVKKLDGSEITITGYIFPLQASDDQQHFLLSAYPPSCPYCLPGGPAELIEVTNSEPIKFTFEPITIRGMFHVLHDEDLKEGMFYRLTHSRLQRS